MDGACRGSRMCIWHLLHGVSCDPGPAAGVAADDPIPSAVRVFRCFAGMGRRSDRVHRFQRLQPDSRGPDRAHAVWIRFQANRHAGLYPRVAAPRGCRLRPDPCRAALDRLCTDRGAHLIQHRGIREDAVFPGAAGLGKVPHSRLPGTVLCGCLLSALLVHVCVRLLAIFAA